jgi:hypothetical protein
MVLRSLNTPLSNSFFLFGARGTGKPKRRVIKFYTTTTAQLEKPFIFGALDRTCPY